MIFPFQFWPLIFKVSYLLNELIDFDVLGVNRLHFSSSIWYISRNQKSIKKKPSYGVLGVSRLQMPDFPTPISTTCLRSVIAPKRIDWFLCDWWHLLAFLKLYMIHVNRSKIDQEKAKLWGERELCFLCAASRSLIFPFQFWPLVFEVS